MTFIIKQQLAMAEECHCGSIDNLRQCGNKCGTIYCSEECQREDWTDGGHGMECQVGGILNLLDRNRRVKSKKGFWERKKDKLRSKTPSETAAIEVIKRALPALTADAQNQINDVLKNEGYIQ